MRRLAAALAAVTIGLLAYAATIPAASATEVRVPQPVSGFELGRFGPVFPAATSAATTGMPGWQITLIALGAAAAAVLLDRKLAGRRGTATA